jgi:hypothetical protein
MMRHRRLTRPEVEKLDRPPHFYKDLTGHERKKEPAHNLTTLLSRQTSDWWADVERERAISEFISQVEGCEWSQGDQHQFKVALWARDLLPDIRNRLLEHFNEVEPADHGATIHVRWPRRKWLRERGRSIWHAPGN